MSNRHCIFNVLIDWNELFSLCLYFIFYFIQLLFYLINASIHILCPLLGLLNHLISLVYLYNSWLIHLKSLFWLKQRLFQVEFIFYFRISALQVYHSRVKVIDFSLILIFQLIFGDLFLKRVNHTLDILDFSLYYLNRRFPFTDILMIF